MRPLIIIRRLSILYLVPRSQTQLKHFSAPFLDYYNLSVNSSMVFWASLLLPKHSPGIWCYSAFLKSPEPLNDPTAPLEQSRMNWSIWGNNLYSCTIFCNSQLLFYPQTDCVSIDRETELRHLCSVLTLVLR